MKIPQPDRRRSDNASRLAYFLFHYKPTEGLGPEERQEALNQAIAKHFPGITDDALVRGFAIATELMRADAMEMNTEAAKLQAELERRVMAARRRKRKVR